MMKKRGILISILLICLLVGCKTNDNVVVVEGEDSTKSQPVETSMETVYPLTLTDSLGRQVVIEKSPERIISVAPNITETIFALGAGERLVGRTNYCDYPIEVSEIESIGLLSDPNQEVITELNPDIIIGSTHFKQDVLENLEALGYTVIVLYGEKSFEGVYHTIETLGLALNEQEASQRLQDEMKNKVLAIQEKIKGVVPKSIYYVVAYGERGDYTATGDTFISDIIEMAGGNNIAKEGTGWKFSYERIVESDPEIIVCSKYKESKKGFLAFENYQLLSAVQNERVYEIDNNLLDRQGPRLADGLEAMAKILHPESFEQ
jgi:iron complex transport system substrate-binding protein